jgi:hypothetical protein
MRKLSQADWQRHVAVGRLNVLAAATGQDLRSAGFGIGPAGIEPFVVINGRPSTLREATAKLEWDAAKASELVRALGKAGL